MSDTPLTDAQDLIIPSELLAAEQWMRDGEYVWADFARDLERQLAEAQDEIERLRRVLVACVDSLEYVDRKHPGQITGGAVRIERIEKAKAALT